MPDHRAVLTPEQVTEFGSNANQNPSLQLMQNIVTQRDVNEVALDHKIVSDASHNFSNVLDDWSVTNQARSGRCWMFAGLNLFRSEARDFLNL